MIRLVVSDIDGCLTPGEAQAWNWQALRTISEVNSRARADSTCPAFTLCTGRPQPYVELFAQAIDCFVPCVYENGCGLYVPQGYRFIEHPAITAEVRDALLDARRLLARAVVNSHIGYFQPGKEMSLSLYPLPGTSVSSLYELVRQSLECLGPALTIQVSVSCVDVTPAGIDKGAGVRWLSEVSGIPLADMAGIGDSQSDLAFLRIVGVSASPANGAPEVKATVDYASILTDGNGVVDIIERWIGA